jgi:hypothetical protein
MASQDTSRRRTPKIDGPHNSSTNPTNVTVGPEGMAYRNFRAPQPVAVTLTVTYVGGAEADSLAQTQWTVIKEVLEWFTQRDQSHRREAG